ncbi:hypothetical protein CLV47_114120 [Antricoccus suffuscus]|uniref:Lumazine-binding protein n=1 Tax=Antricoccus suffuscus TaxID=1629062 RepID=A0A2T0ZWU5_9ACTN|nr:hypothetical protein [Antricoccus suffuscus]PRZ40822.1 hypothetical protein CLV47_114120 [Antricoccus suffuscus]
MSDTDDIKALTLEYKRAADAGDARAMAERMCPDEAEFYLDQFNEDQLNNVVVDPPDAGVLFFDIEIWADSANAQIAPDNCPDQIGTLYYRKYDDGWKLCNGDDEHDEATAWATA